MEFSTSSIFSIASQKVFQKMALKVFRLQYENNEVYHTFANHLHKTPENVRTIEDIPFLPIAFFKTHKVVSNHNPIQITFSSSGTTGNSLSKHLVTDINFYTESYRTTFSQFYGGIENYTILALLPSYQEREGSSLIAMVADFIKNSKRPESGFYLNENEKLAKTLAKLDAEGENVILIGVTYALLDFVAEYPLELKNTIIMETGGMKGRKKEMIREEVHEILKKGFGVPTIHSEYGMTELLSQAYSFGGGVFECPPWMSVFIRDTEDALSYVSDGKTGGINIIDLANVNSCAFIATQDLGKKNPNHSFEVLGRFDHSDIRGCNLLVL
jgi:phenylacetate-coenzyme A ligase PaaK-like adenylate-forming protein